MEYLAVLGITCITVTMCAFGLVDMMDKIKYNAELKEKVEQLHIEMCLSDKEDDDRMKL